MEMIAHRHDRAISKLEQAVERNSSAACATLANLYSKGYCRQDTHSPSVSPSSSVSPPSAPTTTSTTSRPRMPARSTSWNCHHQHQGHRSAESLKAAELYLKGLEIELEKPVQSAGGGNAGKRGRRVREELSSSEEERAEGRYWTLQSTLDLIVGLTDAHRFGVLQPPSTSEPSASSVGSHSKESLDSLWIRSSKVSSRVLSHPTIAPLVSSLSTDPSLSTSTSSQPSSNGGVPPSLSRSMSNSSRRTQSVSRSYTHPVASIPEPGTQQNRKQQVTIAIHALYILALQAFSSPSLTSIPSGLPTPDSSPILIDETPIPFSPTESGGEGNHLKEPKTETGKQLSSTLFNLILLLANPQTNGPIGIKEGDELVNRAQRRLAAIRNEILPGEEDWRLAKKKKKTLLQTVEGGEESTLKGLKIPSSNRHGKERSDDTTSSSMTVTPNSFNQRRNSKFHFATEEEGEEVEELSTTRNKDPYPSPPVTPPPSDHLQTKQLPNLDTSNLPHSSGISDSLRSPPLASPLQPRYHSLHSRSTTHLSAQPPQEHQRRRDSISSSYSRSPSILSRFKHDPSTKLLRRVESSTSVCTVPPDFGATRVLRMGDKGKGKVIDPDRLGMGSFEFGRGEIVAHQEGDLVVEDRKVGKNWLSRFFSVSGSNPVRESSQNQKEKEKKGGVRDRLKEALKRDEEASQSVEYIMDWGDEDVPTEDEEEEQERENARLRRQEEEYSPTSSPPSPEPQYTKSTATSTIPTVEKKKNNDDDTIKISPSKVRPNLPRRQSSKTSLHSKRSFMLNDPTSAAATASSSTDSLLSPHNTSSRSRRRSSHHHRRNASSSSSSSTNNKYLSPLSAANPLPSTSPRTQHHHKKSPVSIDPLLLELERSSRVGVRTVCENCHKKGLNFPACRSCSKCFCSRDCRIGENHLCVQ
ncbi:hypothetical protein JCM3765_002260 [Sporobolomyces pararoseus]